MPKKQTGFTIVELLIVIVVIAILAAISIMAYNGMQQRARNMSRIQAVGSLLKLINAYTATYGVVPGTATRCGTLDNLCTNSGGVQNPNDNTALMDELRKVGAPPQSVMPAINGNYGVHYIYSGSSTFNGALTPIRLEYWLEGQNTPCGLQNVATTTYTTSSTGYTDSTTTRTRCWIMVGLAG